MLLAKIIIILVLEMVDKTFDLLSYRMRQGLERERSSVADPTFNESQITTSTPSDKGGRKDTGAIPKVPTNAPTMGLIEREEENEGEREEDNRTTEVQMDVQFERQVRAMMSDDTAALFSPLRRDLDVFGEPGPNGGYRLEIDRSAGSLETLRAADGATGGQSDFELSGPSLQFYTATSGSLLDAEDEPEREGEKSDPSGIRRSPRLSDSRKKK